MSTITKNSVLRLVGVTTILILGLACFSCGTTDPRGHSNRPQSVGQQRGDRPGMPDFTEAAATLGITEEALMAALGDPGQGPPDFAAAAEELGISEAELIEALGMPENGPPPGRRQALTGNNRIYTIQ